MGLSWLLVHGTNALQAMFPTLTSHIADLITLFLFIVEVQTSFTFCYMLMILFSPLLSDALRKSIMCSQSVDFAINNLGPLSYFLGIAVTRTSHGMFLSHTEKLCNGYY